MLQSRGDPKRASPTKNVRPSPPAPPQREAKHWSQHVHECVLSTGPEGLFHLVVKGGAENGQFCYMGNVQQSDINYHSGKLYMDDVILEIQGQKVAGFTLRDLLEWLKHVSKNATPVMFKTIKGGELCQSFVKTLNMHCWT